MASMRCNLTAFRATARLVSMFSASSKKSMYLGIKACWILDPGAWIPRSWSSDPGFWTQNFQSMPVLDSGPWIHGQVRKIDICKHH